MIHYKILNLPNWQEVCHQLDAWVEQHPELTDEKHSPWKNVDTKDLLHSIRQLTELFKPLGLTIARVSFFIMWADSVIIHVDDTVCNARINLPVRNCAGTWTKFFTTPSTPVKAFLKNGQSYMTVEGPFTEVDKVDISQGPMIFRPKNPHQVVMEHKNFPRISATIAFYEEVVHLLD
jgi:hypothetical protein